MSTNAQKALELHAQWKGKISTEPKCQLKSREDLALAYTPGVAEPCKEIHADKTKAYTYTLKQNTIAVVSDGQRRTPIRSSRIRLRSSPTGRQCSVSAISGRRPQCR